ncbi:unnamed protein product, partial [Ectocarpus sp. 12 AP-2014]
AAAERQEEQEGDEGFDAWTQHLVCCTALMKCFLGSGVVSTSSAGKGSQLGNNRSRSSSSSRAAEEEEDHEEGEGCCAWTRYLGCYLSRGDDFFFFFVLGTFSASSVGNARQLGQTRRS